MFLKFYRNPNPQINDYVQKNYYNSNNTLDSYVKKINELNEILTNEMSKNQV